jgi:hypothetical protein
MATETKREKAFACLVKLSTILKLFGTSYFKIRIPTGAVSLNRSN